MERGEEEKKKGMDFLLKDLKSLKSLVDHRDGRFDGAVESIVSRSHHHHRIPLRRSYWL